MSLVGPDSAVPQHPRHVRCTLNICRDLAVPRTEAMCHEPTSRLSKKSIERYGPPKLIVTHPHEIISGIRHTWPGWKKNSKTLRAHGRSGSMTRLKAMFTRNRFPPIPAVSSKATEVALQPASLKQLASFISAQLQQARLDYFLYFLCHALRQ
jgi:hypothetical protein